MKILIVNVGSTSLKFRLLDLGQDEAELASGRLEGIAASAKAYPFSMKAATGKKVDSEAAWPSYKEALQAMFAFLTEGPQAPLANMSELGGVGFKCVHAGPRFTGAHILTDEVLSAMEEASYLAPGHNPPYLLAIRATAEVAPEIPRAALFEPAFHATMPDEVALYGVPYEWAERYGIRRYGFHGASHRYISERIAQLLGRGPDGLRVISCHLGGSSSITAILGGRSIDHSMGLSPQSGLIQGARTGDLDPFAALYLIEKHGMTAAEVAEALSRRSGLKGMSGISAEFRDIAEAAAKGDARARLAMNAYIHGVRHFIGAYIATLGGLDALVFTGGIGERSVAARARICANLEWLGLRLDPAKNEAAPVEGPLHASDSRAQVWVVPTNEEIIVARACAQVIAQQA